MTTREQMSILASAIRSRARAAGYTLADLTDRQVNELGDAQMQEQPDTIAAQYYADDACTEWHWSRVRAMVRRGRG